MGEFIHTSTDQEAGFEEPEPPSSRLIRITSLLDATWDKYQTTTGDKTAVIHDLYTHTRELREAFASYEGIEEDLPMDVQTALMIMRQPALPPYPSVSPEYIASDILRTARVGRRVRRSRYLGTDVISRFASLRNSY